MSLPPNPPFPYIITPFYQYSFEPLYGPLMQSPFSTQTKCPPISCRPGCNWNSLFFEISTATIPKKQIPDSYNQIKPKIVPLNRKHKIVPIDELSNNLQFWYRISLGPGGPTGAPLLLVDQIHLAKATKEAPTPSTPHPTTDIPLIVTGKTVQDLCPILVKQFHHLEATCTTTFQATKVAVISGKLAIVRNLGHFC